MSVKIIPAHGRVLTPSIAGSSQNSLASFPRLLEKNVECWSHSHDKNLAYEAPAFRTAGCSFSNASRITLSKVYAFPFSLSRVEGSVTTTRSHLRNFHDQVNNVPRPSARANIFLLK
jgi:hypothetical protein